MAPHFATSALHALDNLDLMRGMDSETVHLIYADPPFNAKQIYQGMAGTKRRRTRRACWCSSWMRALCYNKRCKMRGTMCQNSEHNDDGHQHQHRRPPRPSPAAFVANQRNTGLPWHRVATLVVANSWRKLRTGRNCCGNLGQPGC